MAAKKGGRGGPRPGSGRPRILQDPVPYSLDLERADHDSLRDLAAETGISARELVRRALRQFLRRRGR